MLDRRIFYPQSVFFINFRSIQHLFIYIRPQKKKNPQLSDSFFTYRTINKVQHIKIYKNQNIKCLLMFLTQDSH